MKTFQVKCGMRPSSGMPAPVDTSTMFRTVTVKANDEHGARAEAINECYRQWGDSIEHVKPRTVTEQ